LETRERDATAYLKKHKIVELMDNMTSMLLFYRPENPKEFLIEQLDLLKVSRESGIRGPNLFDNSNLTAVCGIMDPANQKYISFAQYKQALTMLGIKDININPEVQLAESVHVIVCFVMNRSASSFF
uniref:EFCAB10 C-terminal EF-hand domain-containing protein n=1 Tax=Xiphophorus couchianus TaxID=32473 RepID=A0A3B5KSM7_9TELE